MSPEILRNKTVTGREARRVAEAVAGRAFAGRIGRVAAEMRRAVRRAELACAADADTMRLSPVWCPVGVSVQTSMLLEGEGIQLSDRVGRFVFFRSGRKSPLMLPAWSVDNYQLTKAGVRAVDCSRDPSRQRAFAEMRADLLKALSARAAMVNELTCLLPGASADDVLRKYPDCRKELERVFVV